MITVDFIKAQAITKDRLRAERAPLLIAQDVAFQRALESGADTSAIVVEKQRLRDITSLVDSCTTLEELRAMSCEKPVVVEAPIVNEPVVETPAEQPIEGEA